MSFEFSTANRIIFGPGALGRVASLAAPMGKAALVVTGSKADRAEPLLQQLKQTGITTTVFPVAAEPTTTIAADALELARRSACDLVIAIGGGSVVDTGKVVAALLANPGDLTDYLEVVGPGNPLTRSSKPYIAIATTAGAGAEVTRNAVLAVPDHHVKVSIRSPFMLPRVALIDPELTYSLPPAITAATGLDALTQLIEAFVTGHANPLTDSFCREGLHRAARSLQTAVEDGRNHDARYDMALAAIFGGLALANAKLGAVHGIAGPLGGMFDAPHGALCARLLPPVMQANLRALQQRAPESPALTRYDEIAQILTANPDARAADAIAWTQSLCQTCQIPHLSHYAIQSSHIPAIIANAQNASSMKGNPIGLTNPELSQILKSAIAPT